MSDARRGKREEGGAPRTNPRAPRGSVDDLRRLIVGPEQQRIDRLEQKTSPETLGDVLPEAVAASHASRGEALSIALEPAMTEAVRNVARRETGLFADVLSPVIGTAVRKSVADAMRSMLERFEVVLERTLTVESLRWRLEARRTGRPFAEVVMLRTLVYRVEQVFLIHSETGILLEHAVAAAPVADQPDQVASMLSAIDSFAQEALLGPHACGHLAHLGFGDLTCFIERGAHTTLAAVVRGVAPSSYPEQLREGLERVELSHCEPLAAFRSDVAPFASVRSDLEALLTSARAAPKRRTFAVVGTLMLAVAMIGLALLVAGRVRAERRFERDVAALRDEPGIVVTSAERRRDGYAIDGLRDPLAEDPGAVLARRGVREAELHFAPFHSADPEIAAARAWRALDPPPGVTADVEGGALRIRGVAPRSFLERVAAVALASGVESLDDSDLHEAESLSAARTEATALERVEVRFESASARLGPGQRPVVRDAAEAAARVIDHAGSARMRACVDVLGYTDALGNAASHRSLAEARARAVADALASRGVDASSLRPRGEGVRPGPALDASGRTRARVVRFDVELRPRSAAPCGGP